MILINLNYGIGPKKTTNSFSGERRTLPREALCMYAILRKSIRKHGTKIPLAQGSLRGQCPKNKVTEGGSSKEEMTQIIRWSPFHTYNVDRWYLFFDLHCETPFPLQSFPFISQFFLRNKKLIKAKEILFLIESCCLKKK